MLTDGFAKSYILSCLLAPSGFLGGAVDVGFVVFGRFGCWEDLLVYNELVVGRAKDWVGRIETYHRIDRLISWGTW